ncbi:transposase [Pedococcus sp. NPDC057267]|uniref:transposase n=1 Tax=Pedococcus sp. NPDC057267 TaxID=3346077 RepID=UPI003631C43D
MPAPRKYSDELRERAVRMVNETLKDNPGMAHKRACQQVGEQLGIPGATLRNWFRDPSRSPSGPLEPPPDPNARLVELERENRELRRANAILKSASAFFAAELDRPPTR